MKNPTERSYPKNPIGYTLLSLLGLIFLVVLYLYTPQTFNPQKTLFLSIFVLICLAGMLAAIYPSHCLRFFKIETVTEYECKNRMLKTVGHHPDCANFPEHVFTFKNKKYCVGCSGLLIGAVLAVLTCLLYGLYGANGLIFWLGIVLVLSSLLQLTFLNIENKPVKFLSNLGLVWGSSFILVGLVGYRNIFLSVYFLFLAVAWIMARTALSRENHERICLACNI